MEEQAKFLDPQETDETIAEPRVVVNTHEHSSQAAELRGLRVPGQSGLFSQTPESQLNWPSPLRKPQTWDDSASVFYLIVYCFDFIS